MEAAARRMDPSDSCCGHRGPCDEEAPEGYFAGTDQGMRIILTAMSDAGADRIPSVESRTTS